MDGAIASARLIWQQFTLTRYLAASVVALVCDMAVFAFLLEIQTDPTLASAVGYCAGIVCHWLISIRFVFVGKTRSGNELLLQRLLFAGSAVIGLAITVLTVECLSRTYVDPVTSKIVAIAISFFAVYLMRKCAIFK